MSIDEKIQTLRALDAEADSKTLQVGALRRGLLSEIEEELRTLRAEKLRREIQYFTREKFAKRLEISTSTLRRAEAAGRITPAIEFEATARYSSLQLEYAGEIFRGKRNADGSVKRQDAAGRRQPAGKVSELREARTA